ncbi:hypothetical protein Dimus_020914 [Dionaea muscipula]
MYKSSDPELVQIMAAIAENIASLFSLCLLLIPCYLADDQGFTNLRPFLNVYKNGTIERDTFTLSLPSSKFVPPMLNDPHTGGVSSKDIIIFPVSNVSARVYLPKLSNPNERIPILIYFHGGGFCVGSAFDSGDHTYLTRVSSHANVMIISVNYRLAPEHPLPAAYMDAWSTLKWLASHRKKKKGTAGVQLVEPWLADHGHFKRVFIGGDSSGANIAHNVVMWAGRERLPNGMKISGTILVTPYFLGSKPIRLESKNFTDTSVYKIWRYVCPSCKDGVDDMHINPLAPGAPSLKGLKCDKLMVYVGETDYDLRARGIWYYEGVEASGWKGKLKKLYEAKGVGHVFPIFSAEDKETNIFIKRLAKFLQT